MPLCDVEVEVPFLFGQIFNTVHRRYARIVDQNVNLAACLDDICNRLVHRRAARDVHGEGGVLLTHGGIQHRRSFRGSLRVEVRHRNICAEFGKTDGNRATNAGAAAGEKDLLAGNIALFIV